MEQPDDRVLHQNLPVGGGTEPGHHDEDGDEDDLPWLASLSIAGVETV